jgi:hypothetical protein
MKLSTAAFFILYHFISVYFDLIILINFLICQFICNKLVDFINLYYFLLLVAIFGRLSLLFDFILNTVSDLHRLLIDLFAFNICLSSFALFKLILIS